MSGFKKGTKKFSDEWKRNISLSHIGLKYPNRKMGYRITEEHRTNISKAIKKWWSRPGNRERMSIAHRGTNRGEKSE